MNSRSYVVIFAYLIALCLLAQMVSCVPIYDDNNQIQALNVGDWLDALYDNDMYPIEVDKRIKPNNRREMTYCMDWIHNKWRRCWGRRSG